jgi:hypothetical protein
MAALGVEGTLERLRALLGSGQPPEWPTPSFEGPVAAVRQWHGDAGDAANARTELLDNQRQRIAGTHRAVTPIVENAAQASTDARSRLDTISGLWHADKTALAGMLSTPTGTHALLQAAALRISQATEVVRETQTQFASLASEVRRLTGELPAPREGGAQLFDIKEEPPPPNPPYPINDVLAEATDLDGNRVILRRGYYDAAADQGFGWDKIYWKHGVINMNVFQDLISHSRPITNDNGVLVYEVPINRSHCTTGFFGNIDCQDTGESVTMRIVVNTTEPRPDVPDGGQKGVITMYPLPGGSGVVDVRPNWTLTPPWVNRNVPIN